MELITLTLNFMLGISVCAQAISAGISEEEKIKAIEDHALVIFHKARARRPAITPSWVNEYFDKVMNERIEIISKKPQDEPWFFVGYEVQTAQVMGVLSSYIGLENIPGWSKEKQKASIEFWQSWQNPETGRFYDPSKHNPQAPKDPSGFCNEKYVIGNLSTLGAKPLYPHTTANTGSAEAGEIDTEYFLALCKDYRMRGGGSWAGKMCMEIMQSIENGRTDLIPVLEQGIENILSQQNSKTGLWSDSDAYHSYGTTVDSLKTLGRLHYRLGVENLPYMDRLADTLIVHQPELVLRQQSVIRNTSELMTICLETSAYRRAELLAALAAQAEGFKPFLGDFYSQYGLGLIGGYLHWEGCKFKNPLELATRGAHLAYRIVVQEDGKTVKIIRKKPEELVSIRHFVPTQPKGLEDE